MALIINGQRVDDGLLGAEFASIKAYFESLGNVSCCERDGEFRGYAKDNITARILLSQEAQKRMPQCSEVEIDETLEKLKKEHGGEDRFLQNFNASAADYPQIRRDLELEMRVNKFVDQIAAEDANADDAALRAFYESHIDLFKTVEEVRASHILKSPGRSEGRAASYELLRDVRRELIDGKDFDEVAKAHSDKGEEHIDLGFFKRGELAEEFEVVAFSMNVGEISPVFASPFGYHIVKLTERKPSVAKPFEDVRDEVKEKYLAERRAERTRELVSDLKASATIEEVGETAEEAVAAHAHSVS